MTTAADNRIGGVGRGAMRYTSKSEGDRLFDGTPLFAVTDGRSVYCRSCTADEARRIAALLNAAGGLSVEDIEALGDDGLIRLQVVAAAARAHQAAWDDGTNSTMAHETRTALWEALKEQAHV